MANDLWVIGDVQGHLESFQRVLRESRLIDSNDRWTGGEATLVVVGDLVDRGPDGIGVIDLLMEIQHHADVRVLIGNHDIFLLAAHRFPQLVDDFQRIGGKLTDLDRLTDGHAEWLRNLPAMLRHGGTLLVHADAMLYLNYGRTLQEVNDSFRGVLGGDEFDAWKRLLDEFSEHRAFLNVGNFDLFRAAFGGQTIVHGHTPIARMLHVPPSSVARAYVYQNGNCVNVDPGLYLGGPGFAYLQPPTIVP